MNYVVNSKSKPLGKGLASLLGPDLTTEQAYNPYYIDTDLISISKYQPRTAFNETELNELAVSIQEVGILQPLVVRKLGDKSYELIAGERRLRASMLAGLDKVPVIVKDFDDKKAFEATLIENIQRSDLTPIEEAIGYQHFIEEFDYSQEELSRLVGKSRSYIANSLRLLKLPEKIKGYVHEGRLTAGHARALLAADDAEALASEIIDRKLNVREAEARAKETNSRKANNTSSVIDQDIAVLELELTSILQSKVKISITGHKGRVEIGFTSLEELDQIISRLSYIKDYSKAA